MKKYLIQQDRIKAEKLNNQLKKRMAISNKMLKKAHLCAPSEISIGRETSRNELLKLISSTKDRLKNNKKVIIDFSKTAYAYSVGTILLYAELYKLGQKYVNRLKIIPPANQRTKQAFKKIGLYRALKQKVATDINHEMVVDWKSAHGTRNDAEEIGRILEQLSSVLTPEAIRSLFGATGEALINSTEHAYLNQDQNLPKDWWMFSHLKDDKLTIVMCDLGVGIPKTFPATHNTEFKLLKAILPYPKDSDIILEAIGHGESRTGESNRGKGLPQIVKSINKIGKNSIIIIDSNKGRITYQGGSLKATKINYNQSIKGTIISWQIPIQKSDKK